MLRTCRRVWSRCGGQARRGYASKALILPRPSRKIEKGDLSSTRIVPGHIYNPYQDSMPTGMKSGDRIAIKTDSEIDGIREACRIASEARLEACSSAKAGMTTDDVDKIVHDFIISQGAYPACLGYNDFPKSVCSSVNEVLVHGIPDSTVLEEGDLVSFDVVAYKNGFYGDCCGTLVVGASHADHFPYRQEEAHDGVQGHETAHKLHHACSAITHDIINHLRPGDSFGRIGVMASRLAKEYKVNLVTGLFSHGVGLSIHEAPLIPNSLDEFSELQRVRSVGGSFGEVPVGVDAADTWDGPTEWEGRENLQLTEEEEAFENMMPRIRPGMVFTVEPIITEGSGVWELWDDKWTIVSVEGTDGGLSAQHEETVVMRADGCRVLTSVHSE